ERSRPLYLRHWNRPLTLSLQCFFFFQTTSTPEIYTLSLHDALPIWPGQLRPGRRQRSGDVRRADPGRQHDRQQPGPRRRRGSQRSEEHTSELQSQSNLVCRLLLEKKKQKKLVIISTSITSLRMTLPI